MVKQTFKKNVHFQGPCDFLKLKKLCLAHCVSMRQKYSQSIEMDPFSKIAKSENNSTLMSREESRVVSEEWSGPGKRWGKRGRRSSVEGW